MVKLLFFHFQVTNSKLKKKVRFELLPPWLNFIFFFQLNNSKLKNKVSLHVTNSKLQNKKFYFELPIRKMKKQNLDVEL